MGMIYKEDSNELVLNFPNSEAVLEAQHNGNVDREVGMFYINQKIDLCLNFFKTNSSFCYIDVALSLMNADEVLRVLKDQQLEGAFKYNLIPQIESVKSLKNYMLQYKEFFHIIKLPYLCQSNKYLKIPFDDEFSKSINTLALGEIISINFRKLGDIIILYLDKRDDFNDTLSKGIIKGWINSGERIYKKYEKKKV